MDSVPSRNASNSSIAPGFLLRFSKLCKLGSVGVRAGENPEATRDSSAAGAGAGGGEETDRGGQKIHPQPLQEALLETPGASERAIASRLFAAISALKSAYIQLQQAHIPYEPQMIQAADALLVSELDTLSELEHLYIGTQRRRPPSPSSLSLAIQQKTELVEELQSELQSRESEILRLRREIEELDQRNAESEEEINSRFLLNRELTPTVFSDACRLASRSIHDFAKPLISLMKASGWDLDRAAGAIDDSVVYRERSHKKYAFEAYLSKAMLGGAHGQCFKLDHFDRVMSARDPFDAMREDPDSGFGRFCRSAYLAVVHPKMESSFFGNLDQRAFVSGGGHPRTPFYQAFARMARWVWALQVMAHSFIPKAEAYCAERGQSYSVGCMESVVNLPVAEQDGKLTVGLTVMPGFKMGRDIIRCRVYLCRSKPSS